MDFDFPEISAFVLPKEVKDNQLPDPRELAYQKARKNRIFYVDFEIDSETGTDKDLTLITKTIIEMNIEEANIPEKDLKPITIFVNSYGGDLDVSLNLADVIMASRIPIITVAMGVAMSAGFIIFLSGTRRYVFNHTNLLIHSGSATLAGTAEQVAAAQTNYKAQLAQMKDLILARTEIPEKVYNKNKTKDWYLTIDDVKNYKIATVVNSLSEIK